MTPAEISKTKGWNLWKKKKNINELEINSKNKNMRDL
jgi:hypothetical protein